MKPIIFSTPMVQAILEGRKTQTRRVIKPDISNWFDIDVDGTAFAYIDQATGDSYKPEDICPYKTGMTLWVRETWQKNYWNEAMVPNKYAYKASPETWIYFSEEEKRLEKKWRPSIFMPREAARIFLKVTNVRVERLQDITAHDAIREGMESEIPFDTVDEFKELWNNLNAKRGYGWDTNPWVWVIEFERINKER